MSKFSDTIMADLVKKALDDTERTITLVPVGSQRYAIYYAVCAALLANAAVMSASENRTDKTTAALSIIKLLQKEFGGQREARG